MSAATALTALSRFLESANDVNLVLGALDGEGRPTLARLTLFDEPQAKFRANASAVVRRFARARELVAYAPGYKPEADEALYLDFSNEPEVRSIVEAVGRLQRIGPFEDNPDIVGRGGFSAVVIGGSGGRKALFFGQFTPKNELGRHKWVSLIMGRDGFDLVHRRVLLFDDEADCVAWQGHMYIRSVPAFERIFRYFELARQRVDAVIEDIVAAVPISNADAFRESCRSQPQMITKTLSIGSKPYLRGVTMERIKQVITEYRLPIQTTGEGVDEKLVFENDPEKRWLILKLLDDDYLYSEMTEARYAANSKQNL